MYLPSIGMASVFNQTCGCVVDHRKCETAAGLLSFTFSGVRIILYVFQSKEDATPLIEASSSMCGWIESLW